MSSKFALECHKPVGNTCQHITILKTYRFKYCGYECLTVTYNLRKSSRSCNCIVKYEFNVFLCEILSFDN